MEHPTKSYLLTGLVAMEAVAMVSPAILAAMDSGLMKRRHLHIVVMNPATQPYEDKNATDEAILYEKSFKDETPWEHDYQSVAQSKAIASWRTGLPTHILREQMPYMLIAHEDHIDTKHYGSAVLYGVVVGVSGVQPWFDEWVAYMVAAACRALCIQTMQTEILPGKARDFIWQKDLDEKPHDDR